MTNSPTLRAALLLALLTCAVALFFAGTLSFDHTPSGDGRRTTPFLEFVANTGQWIPTWNPYKLGGVPILGEPYTFLWLAALSVFDPDWLNFQINAYHLLSIIAVAVAVFVFVRGQGVRLSIATVAAFTFATSQGVIALQTRGVVPIIFAHAVMIAVLWLAVSDARSRNAGKLGAIALLLGIIAVTRLHYAAPFLVLLFAVYIHNAPSSRTIWQRGQTATVRLAFAGLLGIATQALFVIPIVMYNSGASGELPQQWTYPFYPTAITSFLLPAHTTDLAADYYLAPPFIGLLIPVALGLLIAFRRTVWSDRIVRFWTWASLWIGAVLLAQGLVGLADAIHWMHEHFPLIGRFRQPSPLFFPLSIALVFVSARIFEVIARAKPDSLRADTKIAYLSVLMIGAVTLAHLSYWVIFGVSDAFGRRIVTFIQEGLSVWSYIYVLGATIVVLIIIKLVADRPSNWFVAVILCAAAQVILLYPRVGAEQIAGVRVVTENTPLLPKIYQTLKADQGYFRVGCVRYWNGCDDNGIQNVQGMLGFSMFFTDAQRTMFSQFRDAFPTSSRPHWASIGLKCNDYTSTFSELMNLKYLICRNTESPRSGWSRVLEEKLATGRHRPWVLWEREDWTGKVPVLFSWEYAGSEDWNWQEIASNWSAGRAIITSDTAGPQSDALTRKAAFNGTVVELAPSKISIEVEVDGTGLLVLPENYDRGWMVSVNGKREKVHEVYGALRGVFVPPGSSLVKFSYMPRYWEVTKAISIAALLVCAGLFAYAGSGAFRRYRDT